MDRKLYDMLSNGFSKLRTPFIFNDNSKRMLETTNGEGFYDIFDFDLSIARTNHEVQFSGDRIRVIRFDDEYNNDPSIKLNSLKNTSIDLKYTRDIKAVYDRFYLTNSAGSSDEHLYIAVGSGGMFDCEPWIGNENISFLGLVLTDLSDDTQVNSGGSTDTQTLQATQGTIYKPVQLWLDIPDPVGSTANTQVLKCYRDASFKDQSGIFRLTSTFGNDITMVYSTFNADSIENPSNEREQLPLIHGIAPMMLNYDNPIYFEYINNTDAHQTGNRTIKILSAVYKELL